ncbi:MAG: hypothetical protein ACLFS5_01765 [Spirochaetaceae bacterium]
MSKRTEIMKQYRRNAKEADRINDAAARKRWAFRWRELATDAEKRRAPEYLR